MPRPIDIKRIRKSATADLQKAVDRFTRLEVIHGSGQLDLHDLRWAACMSLVEMHAIWERFAEERLQAAMNSHPEGFLEDNSVRGIKRIPAGLAAVLVRGGQKYFDFRGFSDLIDKGKRLVGAPNNPFSTLPSNLRGYLDTMAAIRNFVAHRSDAAWDAYKRQLKSVFNISSAPGADEFLSSIDHRSTSPAKGKKRIFVIAEVLLQAITSV